MQMTACSRKNAQYGQWLQRAPECKQQDPPREITSVQPASDKEASGNDRKQGKAAASSIKKQHGQPAAAKLQQAARARCKQPGVPPQVEEKVSLATTLCSNFLLPSVVEATRRSQSSNPPSAACTKFASVPGSVSSRKRF